MRLAMLLLLVAPLAGCAHPATPASADLYEDLGGEAGITRLVNEFMFRILNDSRIAHHFADTDLDRFSEKLAEQICVEAGGPCTYTGDSMETVHEGLDIDRADFDALVEDLRIAMDTLHIPQSAQNRLLRRLAAMHGNIVSQ
ncbi:MAG TPA: group 1 truncated hemoglobin [Gammaproteobacteria bacterium]